MVGVAEGEPQPVVTLTFADHRDHVGKTGPSAHPRFWLQTFGERKQFASQWLIARELHRARRCVPIGKFDAGRQTNPFAHRRQREAAVGITHRATERGITARAVMHMVAAFYHQRNVVAERSKDVVGPGTERHYRLASRDWPRLGCDAPAGGIRA